MADDTIDTGDELLRDLERLQETLLKSYLDPNHPPLVLERVATAQDATGETAAPEEPSSATEPSDVAPRSEHLSTTLELADDVVTTAPVLDDILDKPMVKDSSSSERNPFLSSKTLEALIAKRNIAQATAANTIQDPVPQAGLSKTAAARIQNPPETQTVSAELQQLIQELPKMIEDTIASYLPEIEKAVQRKIMARAEGLLPPKPQDEA